MKHIFRYSLILAVAVVAACTFRYSFSGASISPDARTFSVAFFPNMAPLVNPVLSAEFTDALTLRFLSNTRLSQIDDDGDLAFEGAITNYMVSPLAITAGEVAAMNRLTIAVQVKFENRIDPSQNFDRSFSQFEDYDSQQDLAAVEATLVEEIVAKLIDDIFNASVANW